MSPFTTAPGTRANASQMESVRPSSWAAPSIWYAAVAAPNTKPGGKARVARAERGCATDDVALAELGHPFTAPAMMPDTSCLPAKMNSSSSGMVASTTPASTIE